jgi:hypothetical protein
VLDPERDILLFFEDRDRDTVIRGDRKVRRFLRKAVASLRPKMQHITGFEMAFTLLAKALRRSGYNVHVNEHRLALRNPEFPVGICGYTQILEGWNLPNPAILGPGLLDHPKQQPGLMSDPRFRSYIVTCDWMRDMFATVYDPAVLDPWFGGIDLSEWSSLRDRTKVTDVLIYDKIRWNRTTLVPQFRDRLLDEIARRGLRYEILRYGAYTLGEYRALLERSRLMLFLCEHETQGIAYQEALASDVPVLAWDQGTWLDPIRPLWEERTVPATSVPYFGSECGERFRGIDDFAPALDRFLENGARYTPRRWIGENLSLQRSGELYVSAYRKARRQACHSR